MTILLMDHFFCDVKAAKPQHWTGVSVQIIIHVANLVHASSQNLNSVPAEAPPHVPIIDAMAVHLITWKDTRQDHRSSSQEITQCTNWERVDWAYRYQNNRWAIRWRQSKRDNWKQKVKNMNAIYLFYFHQYLNNCFFLCYSVPHMHVLI